jgi:hypothetical protein
MDSGPEYVRVNSTSATMKSSPKTRFVVRTCMSGKVVNQPYIYLRPAALSCIPLEDGQVLPDEGGFPSACSQSMVPQLARDTY